MKKTIIIFLILLGFFLSIADVSAALEKKLEIDWPNSPLGTPLNKDTDITHLVKYLYDWGISLGGFAAFVVLVAAGFQYLTSAGNPTKMQDAMARIKSAVIGLTLLLSSVLILNTINPQLTQLKVPKIPPIESIPLAATTIKVEGITLTQCRGARLFPGPNYQGEPIITLSPPEDTKNGPFTVGSVEIIEKSLCQVKLCKLRDPDVCENEQYPATSISYSTPVLEGGVAEFKSAKLINLYYPPKQ